MRSMGLTQASCHSLVVPQQPAKLLAANDLAAGIGNGRDWGRGGISDPLVRTFLVVMVQELPHDVIQVRLAHHHGGEVPPMILPRP
jgi:hypothetical protein